MIAKRILIHVQTPFTFSQVPDVSKYGVPGIASYNATFGDCTVYADWNDLQPMQKTTPAGMNYRVWKNK